MSALRPSCNSARFPLPRNPFLTLDSERAIVASRRSSSLDGSIVILGGCCVAHVMASLNKLIKSSVRNLFIRVLQLADLRSVIIVSRS